MTKIVGVLLPLPFNDVFDYKAEDDVAVGGFFRQSAAGKRGTGRRGLENRKVFPFGREQNQAG